MKRWLALAWLLAMAALALGCTWLQNLPGCNIWGCPTGQHCYCEDGCICVPDVVPSPSPAPSPVPSPSPSPVPPECRTPQLPSDAWELINWGCEPGGDCPNPASSEPALDPAASLRFMPVLPPSTRDDLVEAVIQVIREEACGGPNGCQVTKPYQESHAAIAARLRAKGYCAGQHEDGISKEIVVSTDPPLLGLWLEVHQLCGGDPFIWCWGKINKSSALWRIKR